MIVKSKSVNDATLKTPTYLIERRRAFERRFHAGCILPLPLMPSKPSVSRISGFVPFSVQYDNDTCHILYIRTHVGGSSKNAKKAQWPEDRTIFMVNVPPDATEREIVFLFKSCGTVEKVYFDADGPGEASDDEIDVDSAESDTTSLSHQSHARKKRKTIAKSL